MWDAWVEVAFGSECVGCSQPGRVLCRTCSGDLPTTGFRIWPDPVPDGLAPVWVAARYADPVKRLLIAHKERGVIGLARPLGDLLAAAVAAAVRPEDALALVAVPSSRRAQRRRGHDPVGRMVRSAVLALRAQGRTATAPRILRQRLPIADQAGLDARARVANLAGGLVADTRGYRRRVGAGWTVVVCDDIVTTGATASEAQRALTVAGIEAAAIAAVAGTEKRRIGGPRLRRLLPNC